MKPGSLALLAASLLLAPMLHAANTDPVYYPEQGTVVLPNLKVGSATYYVILKKIGNSNDFRVDTDSVTNLSPPLDFTPAPLAELMGTFILTDDYEVEFTLRDDGTYRLTQGHTDDPACVHEGGEETGTYQYEPVTGVFTAVVLTDANRACGFSHPTKVKRFKKAGNDLFMFFKEDGKNVEIKLLRRP